MLNYIWAGLIVSSLAFALIADGTDLIQDRYRNDQPLPLELVFPDGFDPEARRQPVQVRIDPEQYRAFYGTESVPDSAYQAVLIHLQEGRQLRFAADARLPEPLATIRDVTNPRNEQLQGIVVDETAVGAPDAEPRPPGFDAVRPGEEDVDVSGDTTPIDEEDLPGPVGPAAPPAGPESPELTPELTPEELAALAAVEPDAPGAESFSVAVRFEPVRFVNMNNIAQAALDFATTAAEIAIGLIGVLALFLGLLKIGEEAGIIRAMVRFVRPVLRPLFPQIPEDHPALGMIALNMTANIFGLGNAATPFGIKAMEELQKLNPSDDTATDPMVMLLAVNTASVQLVPPVLLMALMGLQINQLIFAIIITTGISLFVAITAAKLLGRLKGYRRTDPERIAAEGIVPGPDTEGPPDDHPAP
jgi:spore maturation protein SpmA